MSNKAQSTKPKYDLKERTSLFGISVIRMLRAVPETSINKPLIGQLVRSATSIGANYMEADGAESRNDFIHKLSICKKESKETKHWITMLSSNNTQIEKEARLLIKEVHELILIFSAILIKKRNL
jgi:four helix bundle protein